MPSPLLAPALAAALLAGGDDEDDLTALSLEELLQVEVTSVSRKEQSVADSAAAIFVITQEDIRRSGHTAVPELLRMVPGVQVARIDASTWVVTARGFGSRFTDKLLVMIDGRTVYTNLFSGVFWDVQDLPLEDVERIEVVRGPGGTMWGANAVNGVINIITKSARDTQGALGHVLVGNEDRLITTARWGDELGDDAWYRVWVKGTERDSFEHPDGGDGDDAWSHLRAGFRVDWEASEEDVVTVEGDVYRGRTEDAFPLLSTLPPFLVSVDETFETDGGHLLARWERDLGEGEDLSLQAYYDVTGREGDIIEDRRNTLDLDFQHRFPLAERHEIVWGLGYRWIDGEFGGSPALDLEPGERNEQLFSGFVQDEITLDEDLVLTIGTKVEHNDRTGVEVQPTARALYRPEAGPESVWAAVSRAVRTPSLIDSDLVLPIDIAPGMPPTITVLFGTDDFESEELWAYEAGVRFRVRENVSLDVAAFYFDYDELVTNEPGAPFPGGGATIQPLLFANEMEGRSIGLEVAADVQAKEWWRLRGAASLFDLELEPKSGSLDASAEGQEDDEPGFTASLLSYVDVTDELGFDVGLYASDRLEASDIDGYLRVDARVSWRPSDALELEAGVQNLTDSEHQEFASGLVTSASVVERAVYAGLTWRP